MICCICHVLLSFWTFLSMHYWHKILHYIFLSLQTCQYFLRLKHFLKSQMKSIVLGFLTHRSGDVWGTLGSWSGKALLSIRCNWKHMGLNRNNDCRRCRSLCFSMGKVMSGFPTRLEGHIWNSWFNYIFLQDIHTI